MGDHASVKSTESINSDEFDFVTDTPEMNKTPTLDQENGDLSQIEKTLKEVLDDKELKMEEDIYLPNDNEYQAKINPEDVNQDCTIFDGITYLGAAVINAPKSEAEIQRNIAILNEQSGDMKIKVSVSVPSSSEGAVVLYDAQTNAIMSKYEICRISFYARGPVDSQQANCFAFTLSHGETQESVIYQCHVFRCDITEAVSIVSGCFSKAFHRVSMTNSFNSIESLGSNSVLESRTFLYVLEVNLEIKEDDGKGGFYVVYKDKNGFKLKSNVEKQLCLTIKQVSDNGPHLMIERCFGVLVAPGKHVRHSDMQLLEMEEHCSGFTSPDGNCSQIVAMWDPTENFDLLNRETPKDVKQFMTVAVDLVIKGIQEPVRFQIETQVRVINQSDRFFWYFNRKSLVQQFFLNLRELKDTDDVHYEVLSMETSGELDRNLLNLNLNLSSLIKSPSVVSLDTITPKEEYGSDGDEPLLSGTGLVSKDCSVDLLESWADVLQRWKLTKQQPKQLAPLVRTGIPQALRCEVWQRLAGVEESNETMEKYRILITKECPCENVIKRDIARTFPAHDFFKEAGGLGQDSLYRLIKAYAVYDNEVGYCQGLSFLAATLLLHMPEEQAFCVLVKLMYSYGLRDLYKDGFDSLYLRLYQLNRLMEEHLPALWQHFQEHNIETHMFASQWFLTLFTARFPLYFVFRIIDVFLLQGHDTLFQIALALLMLCKKDLIDLDFEGILKYFRVSLPKKFRTEEVTKHLVKNACSIRVKKLKKYENDFIALKEAANTVDESNNLVHLQTIIANHEEEVMMLRHEIYQLKEMLKKEIGQAEKDRQSNLAIISDFQYIRQNLDGQLHAAQSELNLLKKKINTCNNCMSYLESITVNELNSNEPRAKTEDGTNNRIRELEQELAQTKLARVEAECRNQDLIHQLRNSELNLNTTRNNWPPWLSKTLTSIKEAANKKELPTFTYASNLSANIRQAKLQNSQDDDSD